MQIVVNELSFKTSADNIYDAQSRMLKFAEAVAEAVNRTGNRLNIPGECWECPLSENYLLDDWMSDKTVDQVVKSFLLSSISKTPVLIDLSSDHRYNGDSSIGLAYALENNGLAISLGSDEQWTLEFLILDVERMINESQIVNQQFDVKNAYTGNQVISHCADDIHEQIAGIDNGQELRRRLPELFTYLIFCDAALRQLSGLPTRDARLPSVIRHLEAINNIASTWVDGEYRIDLLPDASAESSTTMKQYGVFRNFTCPDGVERFFEMHTKIKAFNFRVHFLPIPETRQVMIGYIGTHLPTVNFHN